MTIFERRKNYIEHIQWTQKEKKKIDAKKKKKIEQNIEAKKNGFDNIGDWLIEQQRIEEENKKIELEYCNKLSVCRDKRLLYIRHNRYNIMKDKCDKTILDIMSYKPKSDVLNINCIYMTNVHSIMDIPGTYGIYIYVTNSGLKYIGQSKNIRLRIESHMHSRFYDSIYAIVIFKINKHNNLNYIEDQMIIDLKPELNIQKRNIK